MIAALRCAREFLFQLVPDVGDTKSGASCDTPPVMMRLIQPSKRNLFGFWLARRDVIHQMMVSCIKVKSVESLLYLSLSACSSRLEAEHMFVQPGVFA
jgi:hypothetical protein